MILPETHRAETVTRPGKMKRAKAPHKFTKNPQRRQQLLRTSLPPKRGIARLRMAMISLFFVNTINYYAQPICDCMNNFNR